MFVRRGGRVVFTAGLEALLARLRLTRPMHYYDPAKTPEEAAARARQNVAALRSTLATDPGPFNEARQIENARLSRTIASQSITFNHNQYPMSLREQGPPAIIVICRFTVPQEPLVVVSLYLFQHSARSNNVLGTPSPPQSISRH